MIKLFTKDKIKLKKWSNFVKRFWRTVLTSSRKGGKSKLGAYFLTIGCNWNRRRKRTITISWFDCNMNECSCSCSATLKSCIRTNVDANLTASLTPFHSHDLIVVYKSDEEEIVIICSVRDLLSQPTANQFCFYSCVRRHPNSLLALLCWNLHTNLQHHLLRSLYLLLYHFCIHYLQHLTCLLFVSSSPPSITLLLTQIKQNGKYPIAESFISQF